MSHWIISKKSPQIAEWIDRNIPDTTYTTNRKEGLPHFPGITLDITFANDEDRALFDLRWTGTFLTPEQWCDWWATPVRRGIPSMMLPPQVR